MTQLTKEEIIYRNPGAGASEFAKQLIDGMGRDEAAKIISELLRGKLHNQSDKRVKRCDYCGYYWRDESLRNTRKTCSDECKTGIKTLQRQQQRERQAILIPKPQKKKLMDDYLSYLEYPYWSDEYSMLKMTWKYEVPYATETIEALAEATQASQF